MSAMHANGATWDGVNFAGYLRTESGVGAAARGYVRAFQALGFPMTLHDISGLTGNRSQDTTLEGFADQHPYGLSVVCADVEPHYAVVKKLGPAFFKEHYAIGVWAWELIHFPEKWFDRFAFYDEIWVGTSFIANALAPIAPVPVVRIPPTLTPASPGSRERGRARIGASDDELVFLFVFDFHSHVERKNPRAVVEAFRTAFRPSDRARLVLKSVNAHSNPDAFAALRESVRGSSIAIYDGYWSASEVRDLMAACDAYVSLHRAEGTGLTITDAMALGKPVIATDWSGNTDFLTAANGFPVSYVLTEIERNVGPYRAGEVWAEPSIDHAAALMRHVFEDPDAARQRGSLARQTIEGAYSDTGVGQLIAEHLRGIRTRQGLAGFRREVWKAFESYQDLGARIRHVVHDRLSPDATVAVVSKGDEALVPADVCRAWHFPRLEDGRYAGSYPADSADAIRQVQELRRQGATHLLFPTTALWWLDHYGDLERYLTVHCREILRERGVCVVYELQEAGS